MTMYLRSYQGILFAYLQVVTKLRVLLCSSGRIWMVGLCMVNFWPDAVSVTVSFIDKLTFGPF